MTDPSMNAPGLDLPPAPSLWRLHGRALLATAAVTVALECGVLAGALGAGLAPPRATMLTLMAATCWVALAAGPLAAGSADWLGAVGRAGVLADASVVVLLALAVFGGGTLGWSEGWRIYLVWASVAMAAASVVRLGGSARSRTALAVGASALAATAMGGLFWSAGLLAALEPSASAAAAEWILAGNPLVGVIESVAPRVDFVWREQPVMYGITRLGQDVLPPRLAWWTPTLLWASLAAALSVYLVGRAGWRRFYYGT